MLNKVNTPGVRLASTLIVGILMVVLTIQLALRQVKSNIPLSPGTRLSTPLEQITLEPLDFTSEPGELNSRSDLQRFYDRQQIIYNITASPHAVSIESKEGRARLTLSSRVVKDLPLLFWIPIFVGLCSLVFAGWIWALRPQDLACRLFAVSGMAIFIAAVSSVVYTTRELGLSVDLFQLLEAINVWGAYLFGSSLLTLFLIYPSRLPRWKALSLAQAVFFFLWTTAFLMEWAPNEANISIMVIAYLICVGLAVLAQFLVTKKQPLERASLNWLGLSVMIGAGGFISFTTIPTLIGTKPLDQGYSFLFFLVIYLGLAAGLVKYRLFEVGQWAFRFLFYATGAVALVLLDAALIYILGVERIPALGLALLVVGFLYLPLRDIVQRRFSKSATLEPLTLLAEALHVTFAPSLEIRSQRWEALIKKLFDPLEVSENTDTSALVKIEEDGLVLLLPPVAGSGALKLSYPWAGRGLFDLQSKQLAQQIVSLIRQAESNREAYDRGVSEERRRVAQDLHDDVGARLLSGLYIADEKLKPTIQGALSDIRSIVRGISGEEASLNQILADLRYETSQRLSTVNIELIWPMTSLEDRPLDYRKQKALTSSLREIVSNVIRHSQATELYVNINKTKDALTVSTQDNGQGLPKESFGEVQQGFGIRNIQRRVMDVGGSFKIEVPSDGGVLISLTIPC
ncbi:MAG: hypothetical protein KUL82_02860 [Bdellovibrio sp.]|nr:hypothetical protein [Bdellovibrio sp.]